MCSLQEVNFTRKSNLPGSLIFLGSWNFPVSQIFPGSWNCPGNQIFAGNQISWEVKLPEKSNFPGINFFREIKFSREIEISREVKFFGKTNYYKAIFTAIIFITLLDKMFSSLTDDKDDDDDETWGTYRPAYYAAGKKYKNRLKVTQKPTEEESSSGFSQRASLIQFQEETRPQKEYPWAAHEEVSSSWNSRLI